MILITVSRLSFSASPTLILIRSRYYLQALILHIASFVTRSALPTVLWMDRGNCSYPFSLRLRLRPSHSNNWISRCMTLPYMIILSYLFWFHRVQSSRRFIGFRNVRRRRRPCTLCRRLNLPTMYSSSSSSRNHTMHALLFFGATNYVFQVANRGTRESFPGQPQTCIKSPIPYGYQTTNQNHPSNLGIHISNDSVKV